MCDPQGKWHGMTSLEEYIFLSRQGDLIHVACQGQYFMGAVTRTVLRCWMAERLTGLGQGHAKQGTCGQGNGRVCR